MTRPCPCTERALKIKEAVPEPENSSTARTLVNLASLHQAMGASAKAQPLYERAVKIREKARLDVWWCNLQPGLTCCKCCLA